MLAAWRLLALLALAILSLVCLLPKPPPSPLPSDKLDHLAAFAAVAWLCACGWRQRGRWLLLLIAWGGAIEVAQGFTGRTPDLADLLADAVGVGLGMAASALPGLSAWRRGLLGPSQPPRT